MITWLRNCGILRDQAGDGQGGGSGANSSTASDKAAPGATRDASQARTSPTNAGEVHSVLAARFGKRPTKTTQPDTSKTAQAQTDDSQASDDGQQQDDSAQDESQQQDDGAQGDDTQQDDTQQDGADDQQQDDSQQEDSAQQDGDAAEGADDQDAHVEFTEEQQKVLNKRIGKEVRKRKDAEKTLETTKVEAQTHLETANKATAELQRVTASKLIPVPTPQVPLTYISDETGLEQLTASTLQFKRWLKQNPEGGPCPFLGKDDQGQPRVLDAKGVEDHLMTAEDVLEAEVPARRRYLAEQAKYDGIAKQYLPELANPQSRLSMEVNKVYVAFPQIKQLPAHKVAAAQFALGAMLFNKLGAQAFSHVDKLAVGNTTTKTTTKVTPKKPPAATGTRTTPRAGSGTTEEAARKNLGSGKATKQDVKNVLKSRFGGGSRAA